MLFQKSPLKPSSDGDKAICIEERSIGKRVRENVVSPETVHVAKILLKPSTGGAQRTGKEEPEDKPDFQEKLRSPQKPFLLLC